MDAKKLLLFVFAFSIVSAQFIDYDRTEDMGTMRFYIQSDSTYYLTQDVRYHLETTLSIPSSQSDRWISGSGSYNDIHDGDYVCEGTFNYQTLVNALALVNDFDALIPSTSGSDSPSTWDNCGSGIYSTCQEGDWAVFWGNPIYEESDHASRATSTGNYHYRQASYEETVGGTIYNDEVADVATIMKGTSSLAYAKSGGLMIYTNLYTFDPLSGTAPSHSGSFTINVAPGTSNAYLFNQRADVTGATVLTYSPEMSGNKEKVWSYDSMSMSKYALSNIHDSSTVYVLDDSDFGVLDPTIYSVTLAGHVMSEGAYTLEAGEDITTTVRVQIPARTSAYDYYLSFQLDQAQVGDPFSYTVNSGLNQCDAVGPGSQLRNGGWGASNVVTYANVVGTLHVPDTLPESGGNIPFRVHWETCQGQDGCDDNGDGGWTPWFNIPYIPPGDDGPLPDLSCSLEPVSIVDTDPATPGVLEPGSSIDQWRLRITNTGGNLTLSGSSSEQLAQYLCLVGLFNAYETNTDGTEYVYDSPGYGFNILTTSNLNLTTGETITKILDGGVQCTEEGELGAWTYLNIGALLSTSCGPYEFEESNWDNNLCEWNIPCVNESGPEIPEDENCTIHPTSRPGEVGGEYNFTLTCDGGAECSGAVDWAITTGGTISGNQTDATAGVLSDASDLLITATVDNTDGEDAVCHAQIYFGENGDGNNCYINPTPQPGLPGSHHWFDLTCSGDGIEDSDCADVDGSPDWSILEGASFVVGSDFTEADSYHAVVDLNQLAINTTIRIEAEVEFPGGDTAICEGEIIVPAIPCVDYV